MRSERSETWPAGQALLAVVVLSAVLIVAGMATIRLVRTELFHAVREVAVQKAFYVAEAGLQNGLARLSADRDAAAATTTYSFQGQGQIGEGDFTFRIVQDPLFPWDPTRKRIDATGRVGSHEATTLGRAVVQAPMPCLLVFSSQGVTRVVTNVAVSTGTALFNGRIHGNRNVAMHVLGGLTPLGNGRVTAVDDLVANSVVSLPLAGNALEAYYGGQYVPQGIHTDLLGSPLLGLHFANGTLRHGEVAAIQPMALPAPDYARVRRDSRTLVVNESQLPGGNWDTGSDTWVLNNLSFPPDDERIYYVEGNVELGKLELARGATATLVARGWIAFNHLSLLSVGSGGSSSLRLIAEKDLVVGRRLLSRLPLTFETETAALLDATTGVGLSGVSVLTQAHLFGFSETGQAWAKLSSLDVLGIANVTLLSRADATLAMNGTLGSRVECAY